jgi:DNA-binding transcriptional MerR regulator
VGNTIRPSAITNELSISASTLRNWATAFADYLSPGSQPSITEKGTTTQRRFTDSDVAIFRLVKQHLDAGLTYDAIKELLAAGEAATPPTNGQHEEPQTNPAIAIEVPQDASGLAVFIANQQATIQHLEKLVALQERHFTEYHHDQEELIGRLKELLKVNEQQQETLEKQQQVLGRISRPWWQRLRG